MNLDPKIAPLAAELLAGFTAFFLGYFAVPHDTARLLSDSPGIVAGAAIITAWLIGTFVDALRNLLIEHVWDHLPNQKIDWSFLIRAERDKVANLERYFLAFYTIDVDVALAIFLFLVAGPVALSAIIGIPVPYYSAQRNVLLFLIAVVFCLDAYALRREIKEYIQKDNK